MCNPTPPHFGQRSLTDPALRRHPASALVESSGGPQSMCEALAAVTYGRPACDVLWAPPPPNDEATSPQSGPTSRGRGQGTAAGVVVAPWAESPAAGDVLPPGSGTASVGNNVPAGSAAAAVPFVVSPEAMMVLEPMMVSRRLRRMTLCLLAESVSRGCRKLVR